MKGFFRDFVSYENRQYPFKIGKTTASALSGFVVGAVAANVIWTSMFKYFFTLGGF